MESIFKPAIIFWEWLTEYWLAVVIGGFFAVVLGGLLIDTVVGDYNAHRLAEHIMTQPEKIKICKEVRYGGLRVGRRQSDACDIVMSIIDKKERDINNKRLSDG